MHSQNVSKIFKKEIFVEALGRVKSGNVRPRTNLHVSALGNNSTELPSFSPQPTMAASMYVPKNQAKVPNL